MSVPPAKLPRIETVDRTLPATSRSYPGLAVPIPTRLFNESTFRTFVSTVRSPVMVAVVPTVNAAVDSRFVAVSRLSAVLKVRSGSPRKVPLSLKITWVFELLPVVDAPMLVSKTETCCMIRSIAFLRSQAESPFGRVDREDISSNFSCRIANHRLGCFLMSLNTKKQPTLSSGLVVLRQGLNVSVINAVAHSF